MAQALLHRNLVADECLLKLDHIAVLLEGDLLSIRRHVGDGAFRKKSGDKMKSILASGVTGILVSHSVGQVREMCNKILWLDHGKQITFTSDVKTCMDAYEQFLQTKKLPQTQEDIQRMSAEWRATKAAAAQEAK